MDFSDPYWTLTDYHPRLNLGGGTLDVEHLGRVLAARHTRRYDLVPDETPEPALPTPRRGRFRRWFAR